MHRAWLTLVLIGVSTLIAVSLAELALRVLADEREPELFAPPWRWVVTDPFLAWTHRPGHAIGSVRINSLGFRGGETTIAKPAGVVRIAILGDSSTFGIWRDAQGSVALDAYPEILAELLAQDGRQDVEVINAGVLGYTTANGLRQLQHRILPLSPDVVVARFGFNDHGMPMDPGRRVVEPESALLRTLFYGLADSALFRLSLRAWRRLPIHPAPFSTRAVEPERLARNLHRFAQLAEREGFDLLLMDYPLRSPARGESPGESVSDRQELGVESLEALHELHTRYQQIIRRTSREAGVPFLDTERACRRSPDPCFGDYDLVHPNRFGARLTASLLYTELQQLGWLAPRPQTE